MAEFQYDFCGWATKNDFKCSDGVTIKRDAFAGNDGQIVPLVWQHNHDDIEDYLGHALLQNRKEGVYFYASLNNTERADVARELLRHGDITSVSIFAKKLKEVNKNILHGDIKELSLVMAGANPGAKIEHVMIHGEEEEGMFAAEIEFNLDEPTIEHSEGSVELGFKATQEDNKEEPEEDTIKHAEGESDGGDTSVQDVLNSLNDDQKDAVEFLVNSVAAAAVEAALQNENNNKEDTDMRHSIFENANETQKFALTADDQAAIIAHAAERGGVGSMKAAVEDFIDLTNETYADTISHADGDEDPQDYGIVDIDMLFPDSKTIYDTPQFIKRRTEWVNDVMTGVKKLPFSRVKSLFADITEDDARARGYIKGDQKVTEVFSLLKRETTPTTIYKLQKLDRDDVIDITSFDVVIWLKGEMRLMWEEEAARAILIGDGRLSTSRQKIPEDKIRPIYTDIEDDLFAVPIRYTVAANATEDAIVKQQIRAIKKGKKNYRGTGNPTFFTTEDNLADMLLLEDGMGRPMYDTVEKLATALGVRKIVTVPVMDNITRTVSNVSYKLDGIIVNLADYAVGADKGGAATMFEDFDLNFNQMEYLYEGRCSGALINPKSALVIEHATAAAAQG
jgi:hypothetical protein